MQESTTALGQRLVNLCRPSFGHRLLDEGRARGLIWYDGALPPGAPEYRPSLTHDLLDYGYSVFALALRLRSTGVRAPALARGFQVAAQAIEAAVRRGVPKERSNGFHRISCAVAYHLAGYAACAYSMLPTDLDTKDVAPPQRVLTQLLLRSLDSMHNAVRDWLLDEEHQDQGIARRLLDDPDFDETDAADLALTGSFMRSIALFDHALATGEGQLVEEARSRLRLTSETAADLRAVTHWWTSKMALHLVDDLWHMSLHQQLPILPQDDDVGAQWNRIRQRYIDRLRTASPATIALWPSQIEAAQRCTSADDDLVVGLPTGAGKTRIAELCILRALSAGQRVFYITPLRALSAQVERGLSGTFVPLGFSVSSLYGAAAIRGADSNPLRACSIVVATPEKFDFALRSEPSLLDDVGLVILDEGHMLGRDERELRYEVFVQRLLRRSDADSRRVVALSALFPEPGQMSDFVAWIRQDDPGTAIHGTWRPTQQRFGEVVWDADAARLTIQLGETSPSVPRFVESRPPPAGSRRRKAFPDGKNELELAVAWKYVEQGKDVLIYCPEARSVNTLAKLVTSCVSKKLLARLRSPSPRIMDAVASAAEWLGPDHPAVQCLKYGVVVHQGQMPHQLRNDIQELLHSGECPLTIASPTLAQGLNLSAGVVLVHSLWREGKLIPHSELVNVAGRAGRPYVDSEGIILRAVWSDDSTEGAKQLRIWRRLIRSVKAPVICSGLLALASDILKSACSVTSVPMEEIVEYVTSHWDMRGSSAIEASTPAMAEQPWESDIGSLDTALLALLDGGISVAEVDDELDRVLGGSLFTRQLARQEKCLQVFLRPFLVARSRAIWKHTSLAQRRGYQAACIGLRTGQFLDANLSDLLTLLLEAEKAVCVGDVSAVDAIVSFARIAFQAEPFQPPTELRNTWESALRGWVGGELLPQIGSGATDAQRAGLQNVLWHRLPWAMEAVRAHAVAVGQLPADAVQGYAAMAVEAGCLDRAVITVLRAGLSSREAAIVSVAETAATFTDRHGMVQWLASEQVNSLTEVENWPTANSRPAWLRFVRAQRQGGPAQMTRYSQALAVSWSGDTPSVGTRVTVDPASGLVLTLELDPLGILTAPLAISARDIITATVADKPDTIVVECLSGVVTS